MKLDLWSYLPCLQTTEKEWVYPELIFLVKNFYCPYKALPTLISYWFFNKLTKVVKLLLCFSSEISHCKKA